MRELFTVEKLGPIKLETCPEMKPYPVRRITAKEYGKWQHNKFIGTVALDDALLDLHEGDIISARLSFHICKYKGKWVQRVCFDNLIKLKEEN